MAPDSTDDNLRARMAALGVSEDDLEENFIRGTGPGGQKINKTASCVQLIHRPSGIEIKCQQERSRARNRLLAREELCDRLEARARRRAAAKKAAAARRRRQKARPSKATKRKMISDKRHRSRIKKNRSRPSRDD